MGLFIYYESFSFFIDYIDDYESTIICNVHAQQASKSCLSVTLHHHTDECHVNCMQSYWYTHRRNNIKLVESRETTRVSGDRIGLEG